MVFWKSSKKTEENISEDDVVVSEETTIDFGEVLDISLAAKLHAQFKDKIEMNSTVNMITSELSRIDASCLQVLASFMVYAKENDIKVKWESPCDVIIEAAHLTGLSEVLELNN